MALPKPMVGMGSALMLLGLLLASAVASADVHEKIRIPVGRSEVVTSNDEVGTVAIAEPKIADATLGSQRSVVVIGKSAGTTTLVLYGEGGRFTIYDVEVYVPNSDKQVALRVHVAEVTGEAIRELGWDFYGIGQTRHGVSMQGGILTGKISGPATDNTGHIDGLTVGPNTDGFFAFTNKFGDLTMQTTWRALEQKGAIRTLANPTLLARSGQNASFLAGGEFPIPIASAGGTSGAVTVTIMWKEFGVKVDFTPTVQEDGTITLKVAPEVSQLDFSNALILESFKVPSLITRKTSTTVELKSGEYLVIGGLKQTSKVKTVRRIPILGSIPLLGFFLSSTSVDNVDKELMVVVSPETVESAASSLPPLPTDQPEKK